MNERIVAAIYARKSTEQKVAKEALSVQQQEDGAREYARAQGWIVHDAHIYVDDGISGAEFERRPGFMRMMNALQPKAPFQVLIVRDLARIGREQYETNYAIKRLAEAGVEIFEYIHGESLTPKNATDKAVGALTGFSNEKAREDASKLMTDAHRRVHKAGHVTGGRKFGYKNVHIFKGEDAHGNPLRSHTIREIDKKEAAVVRRIFVLYDSGLGLKSICKRLKQEGALTPKPFQSKKDKEEGLTVSAGWCPSTVRAVLTSEDYNGVSVRGKTKKKNAWGKLDVRSRPESEWDRTEVEHLRIVPKDLWHRVEARRAEVEDRTTRFASGRLHGRPPKHEAQNLLAGLAMCGVCRGGMVVERSNNQKGRYAYYMCHKRRHHGASCTNALRIRTKDMNEAVLHSIEAYALTEEAVEQVVAATERDDARDQQMALARERKDVEKRIARLVAAVETAGDVASLATKLRELEARRNAIDAEVGNLQPVPRLPVTVVRDRLAEWRRLLRQSTTQGRAVLQRVLRGRIVFTPTEDGGYTFQAETRFDKLFNGIVVPRPAFIPFGNRGAEHLEDRFGATEADYGRLLQRATERATAPERVSSWRARQVSNLRPPA